MLHLAPEQIEELRDNLAAAFDIDDLKELVRYSLPYRLDVIVPVNKPTAKVASELIDALLKRGELVALLRGVIKMRPRNDDVTGLVRRIAPEAFETVDTAGLVGDVTQGLNKLASSAIDASVWRLIGEFQASFRGVATQAKVLDGYKALHDGLHNLQMRMASVEIAASAFSTDPVQSRLLAREVINLREQARRATDLSAALPTRRLEQLWIDDLRQAADEIGESLNPHDTTKMNRAIAVLRLVLQELYRIDGQLASTVAELPLELLTKALDEIAGRLAAGEIASSVSTARDALRNLRPQLEGLVAEHNEWQGLNKALAGIDTNPGTRPDEKVFGWARARKRLQALCGVFAAMEWSAELLGLIQIWESAADAGDTAKSELAANQLNAMVANRFYEVDLDLLQLSGQLTEIGGPITNLLKSSPDALE